MTIPLSPRKKATRVQVSTPISSTLPIFGGRLLAATVEQIRALREQTGAGIMDCKQALEDSGGDLNQAADAAAQ